MQIRLVRPDDRAEWLRLLLELYEGSTEADHLAVVEGYLANRQGNELLPSAVFVAENDDGTLDGFLELSVRDYAEGCSGDTPYIESWFVEADLRRSGVGRKLMEAAVQWARQRGYTEIASDSLLENTISQRAHQRAGFREVERSVHYRKSL